MTVLSVAVVGLGGRGYTHLNVIDRLTDLYRLVAVCDVDAQRIAEAGSRFGVAGYGHPVEMLDRAKPDVVVVAIGPDGHHLITRVAAERGVHVLSETVMATTLAMADHMVESERRHGIKLEVSENFWRFPKERLKQQAVAAGSIGRVQQVHCWYTSGSYHGISAVRRLIDAPVKRAMGFTQEMGVGTRPDGTPAARPWELGVIEFADGRHCVYQWPVGTDRGNTLDVIGTNGSILGSDVYKSRDGRRTRIPIETELDDANGAPTIGRLRVATDPPVEWENPYRKYALPPHDDNVAVPDIYAGLHRAIVEHVPVPYGPEQGRADQEVLIALRESARRGSVWIDLPLREETGLERQLHEEFRRRYGGDPIGDAVQLLSSQFPREGLQQTVHAPAVPPANPARP